MPYLIRLFVFLLIVASVASCRSTKKIQTAMSKKDSLHVVAPLHNEREDSLKYMNEVYRGVEKNRIDFTTFSAKVKVDFEGKDGKKSDFNAFFRVYKDSVIWVSINALLGIQAFRILITPDSVKVLNGLDKIVQLRSVSYLKEITKLPFTFSQLQDLLIGNPIYFDSNLVSYKKEGGTISLMSMGKIFKHLLSVNPAGYTILHSKLDDLDAKTARTADITYGEYESKNGINFSTYRKITVIEKAKLDIEMKYKSFDFNEPLNFPFNIPKNYKLQ